MFPYCPAIPWAISGSVLLHTLQHLQLYWKWNYQAASPTPLTLPAKESFSCRILVQSWMALSRLPSVRVNLFLKKDRKRKRNFTAPDEGGQGTASHDIHCQSTANCNMVQHGHFTETDGRRRPFQHNTSAAIGGSGCLLWLSLFGWPQSHHASLVQTPCPPPEMRLHVAASAPGWCECQRPHPDCSSGFGDFGCSLADWVTGGCEYKKVQT